MTKLFYTLPLVLILCIPATADADTRDWVSFLNSVQLDMTPQAVQATANGLGCEFKNTWVDDDKGYTVRSYFVAYQGIYTKESDRATFAFCYFDPDTEELFDIRIVFPIDAPEFDSEPIWEVAISQAGEPDVELTDIVTILDPPFFLFNIGFVNGDRLFTFSESHLFGDYFIYVSVSHAPEKEQKNVDRN